MKLTRILSLILALSLMVACFAACTQEPAATDPSETAGSPTPVESGDQTESVDASTPATQDPNAPVDIEDQMGRSIHLDAAATRVVALTAAECDMLYALGMEHTLVGRGEYCDTPASVLEVPSVGSGENTNLEEIIALQPQIVLMSDMAQTKEQVEALESAGIRVLVTDADTIAEMFDAVVLVGQVVGKGPEAEALVESMRQQLLDIAAKSTYRGEATVYFEVSPLQYGLWTAGSGTFMNEIAEILGLKNIFEDVEGWAAISEEQVLERNPDFIVSMTMYYGEGPTPTEELMSRPGWENVTAIQNNSILNLQNDELSTPSPILVEGTQMMFDFVYGQVEQ